MENNVFFVLSLVVLLLPIVTAAWVLHPLDRAARHRRIRVQITVLDFLGLVFLLQIPLALLRAFIGPGEFGNHWIGAIVVFLASTLIWWTGVRTFGQAEINDSRVRAILVFLVLPVAYFGSFGISATVIAIAASWPSPTVTQGLLLIALTLALRAAGEYTHRLMSRGTQPYSPSTGS
jgi:hypothetical protein